MITVLSHRGFWKTTEEKNGTAAFLRSFEGGFGTETDVRDLNGQLVISHDPPTSGTMAVDEFFALYKQVGDGLPLALNIKSDGLQRLLRDALGRHQITNYFVFDMSIPDTLLYLRDGMTFFTRQSEYEPQPAFYDQADGVWIDGFRADWLTEAAFLPHLASQKRVCLVSPELHKRPHLAFWNQLKAWGQLPDAQASEIMLCTDFPDEASLFFHEPH